MRAIKDLFGNKTWTNAQMDNGVDQATLNLWRGSSGSIFVTLALFGFVRVRKNKFHKSQRNKLAGSFHPFHKDFISHLIQLVRVI